MVKLAGPGGMQNSMENSEEMITNTQDKMLLGKFQGTEDVPMRQQNVQ
jgi:hypothetical protein